MIVRHIACCLCLGLFATGCGRFDLLEQEARADSADLGQDSESGGRPADELAMAKATQDDDSQRRNDNAPQRNDDEPKSRIVRALLAVLDELDEDDEEATFENETDEFDSASERREFVEKILRDSDVELSRVLQQNSKEAILRANQRRPHVVIHAGKLPVADSDGGDSEDEDDDASGEAPDS